MEENHRTNLWSLFTVLVALIMGGVMFWYADSQQQKINELSEQVEMLNAEAATLAQENATLETDLADEKRLHDFWFDKHSKLRQVICDGVGRELYLINYGMSFASRQDLINTLYTIDNLLEVNEVKIQDFDKAQKVRFEKRVADHTHQQIENMLAISGY